MSKPHEILFSTIFSNISSTLCEKCTNTEFFWSIFSGVQTEYGEIRSIYPYSVRMRENTDQKKLRIWTLFRQWHYIRKCSHNCFYTKDLTPLLHVKRLSLSFAETFRSIHFLPSSYKFWQCVRCAIFKINNSLVIK